MFEFINKLAGIRRSRQSDKADEAALRRSLAEKLSHYRSEPSTDETEYTQVKIGGRKLRVEAQHITLTNPSD